MNEGPEGASSSAAARVQVGALDRTGEDTLELFRENDRYSAFLWERLLELSPLPLEGRVLEVGCGIGNLTRILLRAPRVSLLEAIDLDPAYVRRVAEEIRDPRLRVTAVRAEDFRPSLPDGGRGAFDFVVSTNVLEHIEDDGRAFSNFRRLLRPGGLALILVPAHPFLYSALDRNLSHFRRYRKAEVRARAREAGFEVVRLRHFNPLGALGWWLNGKVLRRKVLPRGQLSLYTRFAIPLSSFIDRWNPFPLGVSLLAVLEAVEGPAPGGGGP